MINELTYIFYILADAFIIYTGFSILKIYKKFENFTPWFLIVASFVADITANIPWLYYLITIGEDNIPYPSFMDFFWLISYLFLGLGIMSYFINFMKSLKKEGVTSTIALIALLTIQVLIFFYWLYINEYFSSVIDVLTITSTFFLLIMGVPLVLLTRGGSVGRFWFFITLGSLFAAIAQVIWSYLYTVGGELWIGDTFWIISYLVYGYALFNYKKLLIPKTKKV